MPTPSPTELKIMRSMLTKAYGPQTPFIPQLSRLQFDERHPTGVGFWEIFTTRDPANQVDDVNNEITEFVNTSLASPADTVGFTLFIRNGYLSSFEGYTFGNVKWPEGLMENWLVLDAA